MMIQRGRLLSFLLSLSIAVGCANAAFAAEPQLVIHFSPSYNRVPLWLRIGGESPVDSRVHEVIVLSDGQIVLRGVRRSQIAEGGQRKYVGFAVTYSDQRNLDKSIDVYNAAVKDYAFLKLSSEDIQRLRIAAKQSGTPLIENVYHFTAESRESDEGFGMFGLHPDLYARCVEQNEDLLRRMDGTIQDARILSVRVQRSGRVVVKVKAHIFNEGQLIQKDLEFQLSSLAEYNRLQSESRLQIAPEVLRNRSGLFRFDNNQVDYRLYSPVAISSSSAKCRKILN